MLLEMWITETAQLPTISQRLQLRRRYSTGWLLG